MKKTVKYGSYLITAMLICISADAATRVIEGETGSGAMYQITVPDNWNGDLVVYAHGIVEPFMPVAPPIKDDIQVLRDTLVSNDYAVAYSSYSANGFAVQEGIRDTRFVNNLFIRNYGQPERTFLVGHSLGGAVCVKLAELHPKKYDGVLTVAGMIGGSQAEIAYMANVRILWEFFYPDVLPGDIFEAPPIAPTNIWPEVIVPTVTAMTIDPTGAGAIALIDQTPVPWDFINGEELGKSFATIMGFWYVYLNDVSERTGGKGFYDNTETDYTSFILPDITMAAINEYVERFEGSNQAERYLWRYFEPTGKISTPHFSLHNSRDPAVPAFHETLYAAKVAEQGNSDLLAQRISDRYGHTETYPAEEVFEAFEELVEWVDTGIQPTP
jgi:pimeloyl-ACP methyl ester carboxylesterase